RMKMNFQPMNRTTKKGLAISSPLIILGLLLLLATGGCKVGQNYSRPALNTPSTFNYAPEDLMDSVNIATINWREFFDDSVLVSLIDSALKNNLNLRQLAGDVRISGEDLKQAKVNFLPNINLEAAGYEREHHSSAYYSNPSSN